MTFWTYMLECADGRFYVGHTDDLERRIAEHQSGVCGGYTSTRRPVRLVWSETFQTRDEARSVENQLKGWRRAKKMALIRGDWAQIVRLARSRPRSPVPRAVGTGPSDSGYSSKARPDGLG